MSQNMVIKTVLLTSIISKLSDWIKIRENLQSQLATESPTTRRLHIRAKNPTPSVHPYLSLDGK